MFELVLMCLLLCVREHIWGSVLDWLSWLVILGIGRLEIGRLMSCIQHTAPLVLSRSWILHPLLFMERERRS
ncbi:hypothetical protein BGZ57DRAFT_890980, partial [Hyaloscypha finlandica]